MWWISRFSLTNIILHSHIYFYCHQETLLLHAWIKVVKSISLVVYRLYQNVFKKRSKKVILQFTCIQKSGLIAFFKISDDYFSLSGLNGSRNLRYIDTSIGYVSRCKKPFSSKWRKHTQHLVILHVPLLLVTIKTIYV